MSVRAVVRTLRLPPPEEFLWQYVQSTPLVNAVAQAGEERRAALAREICARWAEFVQEGGMVLQVGITTAGGTR